MLGAHLPGMFEYVASHPGAFALRFVKDVAGYVLDLLDGLGPIAVGAAFLGVAIAGVHEVRVIARRQAPFLLAIALQIFAMSALERSPRFLVPVLPLLFVLLADLAGPALEKITRREAWVALLLVVMLERGVHVLL